MKKTLKMYSFFPGCSMKTSAQENLQSLLEVAEKIDLQLIEIDDWNCCGSSSAHSLDARIALRLACRSLFRAPGNIPIVVACPSCHTRLKEALHVMKTDPRARAEQEGLWGRRFNVNLEVLHLFDVLDDLCLEGCFKGFGKSLKGLKFAPYYGCMLQKPASLGETASGHQGLIEDVLIALGAEPVVWSHASKCCGTFLSVAKPAAVTPAVNDIVEAAKRTGADCIVSACAMCHLNIEIRCDLAEQIPALHLTELISVALGTRSSQDWFKKHLVDPMPLFKSKGIL